MPNSMESNNAETIQNCTEAKLVSQVDYIS